MGIKTNGTALKEFWDNFDNFAYPQPLVADVIFANTADLNTWRSRDFITIGVDKGTRVSYTGRGLIHAGIVNELAHFLSPKRAAHFSMELMNTVEGMRNGLFHTETVEFHRGFDPDGMPSSERELHMVLSQEPVSLNNQRAQLHLPLANLIEAWGISAQLRLTGGNG